MYAIRLTFPYDRLIKTFSKIQEVTNRLAVYQHDDASRVHVHALLVGCTVSTDTLKNWIMKEVNGKVERSNWGFKQAPNESFITYMTKGKYEPKLVKGYTPEEIDEFKSKWVDRPQTDKGKLIQYRLKIENPHEQKKRQQDMIQEIGLRYKASTNQTGSELIAIIRQVVVVENKTILGRYKLRDYYDTVMMLEEKETWIHQMEKFCCVRI